MHGIVEYAIGGLPFSVAAVPSEPPCCNTFVRLYPFTLMPRTSYAQVAREIIEQYLNAIRAEQHKRKLSFSELGQLLEIKEKRLQDMYVRISANLEWMGRVRLRLRSKSAYGTRSTWVSIAPFSTASSAVIFTEASKLYYVAKVGTITHVRTALYPAELVAHAVCPLHYPPSVYPGVFQRRLH